MKKIFIWVQNRFHNVWNSNYPKQWHLVNLVLGIISSIIFVIKFDGTTLTKIALFIPLVILGYLTCLMFSYGIVRSRKAWTKKRK